MNYKNESSTAEILMLHIRSTKTGQRKIMMWVSTSRNDFLQYIRLRASANWKYCRARNCCKLWGVKYNKVDGPGVDELSILHPQ
jgi:hypothetical protein